MTMMVVVLIEIAARFFAGWLGGDRLRHVDCDRIAGIDMISGGRGRGGF